MIPRALSLRNNLLLLVTGYLIGLLDSIIVSIPNQQSVAWHNGLCASNCLARYYLSLPQYRCEEHVSPNPGQNQDAFAQRETRDKIKGKFQTENFLNDDKVQWGSGDQDYPAQHCQVPVPAQGCNPKCTDLSTSVHCSAAQS